MTKVRSWAALLTVLVILSAGSSAPGGGVPADRSLRYPSSALPDEGALQAVLEEPGSVEPDRELTTIVFERGTHRFSRTLRMERSGLVLRGSGGGPGAVVLESSDLATVCVRGAVSVEIRSLSLRNGAEGGIALLLEGTPSPETRKPVADVTVRRCVIEGADCLRATSGVDGLAADRCVLRVTRSGGTGLAWQDGTGLFLSRTTLVTSRGIVAAAGLEVRGVHDPASAGRRAGSIVATRNRFRGAFARGIDIVDADDVRIVGNRMVFPAAVLESGDGVVGIAVRQSNVSGDFEVSRNHIVRAHTAIRIVDPVSGWLLRNRMRKCATPEPDTRFGDEGAAVRLTLGRPWCETTFRIRKNDFRSLRSPVDSAAVIVEPMDAAPTCVSRHDGNRLQGDRPLVSGESTP